MIALAAIVLLSLVSAVNMMRAFSVSDVAIGRGLAAVDSPPGPGPCVPAPVEDCIVQNARALGFDTSGNSNSEGCLLWKDKDASPICGDLHAFKKELSECNLLMENFTSIPDLRLSMDDDNHDVCNTVELHQDGLRGMFQSGQLSLSSAGCVEPLFTPMRHPGFCWETKCLLDLSYMVHDFGAMCRKLKRTSRMVLADMGASLDFHAGGGSNKQPAVHLTELCRKFGFPFDHIYAFEITKKDPNEAHELVPEEPVPAHHWINVAVNPEPGHRLNPLELIANNFNADDFIVIELDVDPNSVELPLAQQLLNDDRFELLVDQFYFEHHVHLEEIAGSWGNSMEGSVKDSLDLFSGLRQKGIPAHFWV